MTRRDDPVRRPEVSHNEPTETEILDILWQSLRGGDYDLEDMKRKVRSETPFEDLGIDSLDMTAFFIRIEDRYQVKILQEEYPSLASVGSLRDFLTARAPSEPAA
jgi:acyl carrier protein